MERETQTGAGAEELKGYYNRTPSTSQALEPGDAGSPCPTSLSSPFWERWAEEARQRGAFAVLAEHLPQLRFPIREGMSETEAYRAATRRGECRPDELPGGHRPGAGAARGRSSWRSSRARPAASRC